MDHLFESGEAVQVAMDDDAVEAVVYKNEQADNSIPGQAVEPRSGHRDFQEI